MRFWWGIILVCFYGLQTVAQVKMVNVGLYYGNKPVQAVVFTPVTGRYVLFSENGKEVELTTNEMIYISYQNDGIKVQDLDKVIGVFKNVNLIGTAARNSFKIKCEKPNYKPRSYDDNLLIRQHDFTNSLVLINNIDLDNYVAGVVEAEVGPNPPVEYFKLQAIICRTYALKSYNRHESEGFNLCDRVHCQAYHGRPKNYAIRVAAYETSGIVVVDSDINLITAAFHSNCGGQTANSEEVWSKPVYYLRSVPDTFCRRENNACWQKEYPKSKWLEYLHRKIQLDLNDSLSVAKAENIIQHQRQHTIQIDSLHRLYFTEIRKDFKLKSAFFDVIDKGNTVLFKGKGFGHGVGLCQEGAMRMAKMGYTYPEILHYYYRGVHMIHISTLDFFKEE